MLKPRQTKDIQIEENGEIANIKSSHISVELNQQTGEIRFLSRDGKLLLTDTQTRLEARKDEANKPMMEEGTESNGWPGSPQG